MMDTYESSILEVHKLNLSPLLIFINWKLGEDATITDMTIKNGLLSIHTYGYIKNEKLVNWYLRRIRSESNIIYDEDIRRFEIPNYNDDEEHDIVNLYHVIRNMRIQTRDALSKQLRISYTGDSEKLLETYDRYIDIIIDMCWRDKPNG